MRWRWRRRGGTESSCARWSGSGASRWRACRPGGAHGLNSCPARAVCHLGMELVLEKGENPREERGNTTQDQNSKTDPTRCRFESVSVHGLPIGAPVLFET